QPAQVEGGEQLGEAVEDGVDADQVDEHDQGTARVPGGPHAEEQLQDPQDQGHPPVGPAVVGEGPDDVDDALEDQEPGQHHRGGQQGLARPDEGDDPGDDRQHPPDQVEPAPALDPAGGQDLVDHGHDEGDAGEHGQGEQAAHVVGQHEHPEQDPQDPQDQEQPPAAGHPAEGLGGPEPGRPA